MLPRLTPLFGLLLIGVAVAAVPSAAVVPASVGGSAVLGHVTDGRYFVNPGHGRPVVEVSERSWRAAYWVECLRPWSALLPGWAGLFLGIRRTPTPSPPGKVPPRAVTACLAGSVLVLAGAAAGWALTGSPWAAVLVGWALVCACVLAVGSLCGRGVRDQGTASVAGTDS